MEGGDLQEQLFVGKEREEETPKFRLVDLLSFLFGKKVTRRDAEYERVS